MLLERIAQAESIRLDSSFWNVLFGFCVITKTSDMNTSYWPSKNVLLHLSQLSNRTVDPVES